MADIVPYNQHFIHVAQLIGKPSDVAVFQYLWDKYCYNIRNGLPEVVKCSFNDIATQRNISLRIMPKIIQNLVELGLIKVIDKQTYQINGKRYIALSSLFYRAIKEKRSEDVVTAFVNADFETLKSLGLNEEIDDKSVILGMRGFSVDSADHAKMRVEENLDHAKMRVDSADHAKMRVDSADHAKMRVEENLEHRLQKWIAEHESIEYLRDVVAEVQKCLNMIDRTILDVLGILTSAPLDKNETRKNACADLQKCVSDTQKCVTENKYNIKYNINNILPDNTCFNKLKHNNTVTSFSFLPEEKEDNQEKERILENSRFPNKASDADENFQDEIEDEQDGQKTEADEEAGKNSQFEDHEEDDDPEDPDDGYHPFVLGKVDTELRDFNAEYREELRRKRASQPNSVRRTAEDAERREREQLEEEAEEVEEYSSQVIEKNEDPDASRRRSMEWMIQKQRNLYPYFKLPVIKDILSDMRCCLDRPDKIFLNRMWDILGEYLSPDVYTEEDEEKPDRVDPEGRVIDADRVEADILRPAYRETCDILEAGEWTDKFGERYPVTCGKELPPEKVMLMVDWERQDGLTQHFYKITYRTFHDTYAEKIKHVRSLPARAKRGEMCEAKRNCYYFSNIMRQGDLENGEGSLSKIELVIYRFGKKHCKFDADYHFDFDNTPKNLRRIAIVEIYNSLDDESKEELMLDDVFGLIEGMESVMDPQIILSPRMFSYRKAAEWNQKHGYRCMVDGENHDNKAA